MLRKKLGGEKEKMKKIVAILMAMLMVMSVLVAFADAGGATATTKEKQSEKKPVIIMFKDQTDQDLVKQHGGTIKSVYQIRPALAASLPQEAIDTLKKHPKIDYIVEDLEIFTMAETLDWGVDRIDADAVHEYNRGTGVKVAIMDTGIDYDHPDLAANYKGGYDFGGDYIGAPNDDDPMDFNGHGTHCAGIVAAVKENDIGVIGVAPEADLYAVKVFSDDGYGRYSDVVEALEWCIATRTDENPDNDIQVISMSFGSSYSAGDPGIEPWIDAAYDTGILLVGAAGNDGNPGGGGDNVIYPARYDNVIAVAATDSSDNRASWSSTGPDVELAAPGVSIYSTYWDNTYATLSGTSMACPMVSGTAALVMAFDSSLTNADVRVCLQETADDLGATGRDTWYGYGLVDADEAAPPVGPPNEPPIADAGPDQTAFVGETVTFDGSGSYDPDGTFMSYDWNFGDGTTGTGVITTHAYSAVGVYTVTLTVTDSEGATGTDTALVNVTAPNEPPVADAGPDQMALVGETVTFNGSGSYDPDGTIVSYDWDFGDGTNGTGVTTTHAYSTAGIYTVTLTVTDNEGAPGTDTASVNITAPNEPPVADAGPDQTALVGETVTFNGSGSYDPDGTIESYDWNFGDGTNGTGVTTTHAYSTAGTYTVTLTVTDDEGAAGTDTAIVTVTEPPANTMHVASIVMSTTKYRAKGWFTYATATVTIVDASGEPVEGATVSGTWSGLTDDPDSGLTDVNGQVALDSDSVKNARGTFTFTVDNVVLDGWEYDPDANGETSDSITV